MSDCYSPVATATALRSDGSVRPWVTETKRAPPYHRRPMDCCCIRPGDTDGGGLDIEMPVAGLIIGIALRVRVAEGWWSFNVVW